jgi:hypothetical protein
MIRAANPKMGVAKAAVIATATTTLTERRSAEV